MQPNQGDLPAIYAALNEKLSDSDGNLSNEDAIAQAILSKDTKNKARSNTLIDKILAHDPHHQRAIAMRLASLRHDPENYIAEFKRYSDSGGRPNKAVFTTVGAAYLDLGDITLALKYCDRAHAMSGGNSQYTMALYQAIKKEQQRRDRQN